MNRSDIIKSFVLFAEEELGATDITSNQIILPVCPFCGESRKNKVYFGLERGYGDCKVCGNTFDAVRYVAAYLNISNKDAYRKLIDNVSSDENIVFKKIIDTKDGEDKHKPPVVLPFGKLAIDNSYLQNRNIDNNMIRKYNLIACENGLFRGRIIIPIYDVNNNLVTYQGRDYTGMQTPKYLFPKNFNVKKTLYNINYIPNNSLYVILTEGVFGCFGWERAGLKSVATFGKSMSYEQIKLLVDKKIKNLYIVWDLDAIPQIITLYKKFGHFFNKVYYIYMESDADETNPDELQERFLNAPLFKWETLMNYNLKNLA